MAPSWSSRFLAGASSSSRTNNKAPSSRDDAVHEKRLPSLPTQGDDDPRPSPAPPRPRTAGASTLHTHNRSASQPIPKVFSRKKSAGNLRSDGFDGAHPPAANGSPVDHALPGLSKAGGKRKDSDNKDTRIQRRCICCDSRVKLPQELDKFRCMSCLTINDLKPFTRQKDDQLETLAAAQTPPLTVERTRAILERCLMAYLETRSRRRRTQEGGKPAIQKPQPGSSRVLDGTALHASPPTTPSENFSESTRGLASLSPHLQAVSPRVDTASPVQQRSVPRKPVSAQSSRRPLPPPVSTQRTPSQNLRPGLPPAQSYDKSPRVPPSPHLTAEEIVGRQRYERIKTIFRPLDDYIVAAYGSLATLNSSFSTVRPVMVGRARSESHITTPPPEPAWGDTVGYSTGLDELDAKMLLLGDIGENGSWWTGKFGRHPSDRIPRKKVGSESRKPVNSRTPNINWSQVAAWYDLIHCAGMDWQQQLDKLKESSFRAIDSTDREQDIVEIEQDLQEAREHTIRTLLKITENILKRPGQPIKEPEHIRFLFIILANPSFYPASIAWPRRDYLSKQTERDATINSPHSKSPRKAALQHTGLLKRVLGLLSNTPDACHRYVVGWLSRLGEEHFVSHIDLCTMFINYRLARRSSRPSHGFVDGGLIPDLSGGAMSTSAQLHSAMGLSGSMKKRSDDTANEPEWASDWQIKSAAKVMSLLFSANNIWQGKRKEDNIPRVDSGTSNRATRLQDKVRHSRQLLPTSSFYNTLLDYHDLIADFKVWESKKEKFSFCQYPFFLSMSAKTRILEYDARRQMEIKAREAIFDQVINQRAIEGQLNLRVRRECMVEDSLRQISEAVGSGQEELKKGLRVQFANEEGVDAGGLRKEWFLMLAREVFDAEHGLFIYDEQSRTCYFNPHTFETSDQFYLVGALLGLAIYNSTILDIALPSFAFKKLLAAAPPGTAQAPTVNRPQMSYTLADLAEYKPSLAAGLQQLLDFDGDVAETYCWSFVAPIDKYGATTEVALVPGGENLAVTNDNRHEFVDAYIRYLLDVAVTRQFEPFKRGFFTVCAGNALSLFRAEEIELLIRGSDETLDVQSLRAVATHENWRDIASPHASLLDAANSVPVVEWFWDTFEAATPELQRRLLAFITSSDRIPAVGATSLMLRIVAGGDGWSGKDSEGRPEKQRYPIARTCFNMLVLWQYESREQLEQRLWRAVTDSEGFGLK